MKICPECQREYDENTKFCLEDGTRTVDKNKVEEDPMIGQFVDKDRQYQVLEVLGAGGMGKVYKGRQESMSRDVAIKTLHKELLEKPDLAKRFQREARAAAKLRHQHAVEVFVFGQCDAPGKPHHEMPYMVMEFVAGRSLHKEIVNSKRLDEQRTIQIMLQVCDVLDEAHRQGIIHRDLKPENIVLTERGRNKDFVKVLDFGIAKLLQEEEQGATKLTQAGSVFGTPQYLSPEQASGTPVDARSDIYSLGVILYEMLTGKVPFQADTAVGFLLKHVTEDPQPLRQFAPDAGISEAMERIVLKALAKDPAERHQSVMELADELRALQSGASAPVYTATGPAPTVVPSGPHPALLQQQNVAPPPVTQNGQQVHAQTPIPSGPGTLQPQVIQPQPTGGGRGGLIAGLFVLLLAGAAGASYLFLFKPQSSAASTNNTAAALGTSTTATPEEPTPPAEEPVKPEHTPPEVVANNTNNANNTVTPQEVDNPPPPAKKVSLTIRTQPKGAEVLMNGEFIGLTPLKDFKIEASDKTVVFTIQKEGFETRTKEVVIDKDKEFEVLLEKASRVSEPDPAQTTEPPPNTPGDGPKQNNNNNNNNNNGKTNSKKVIDIMGKRNLGGGD